MALFRADPFLGHWWDLVDRPARLFDQHFGSGLLGDELLTPMIIYRPSSRGGLTSAHRPRHLHSREKSGTSEVRYDKDKFQVMLDVQQFKPEEINVKTVDNCVVISGKHEERRDEHGFISRQFTRRYMLPDGVKADAVNCNLSSDGVLVVTAPRKQEELPANERAVPIMHTGQPAVIKQNTAAAVTSDQASGDAEMKE